MKFKAGEEVVIVDDILNLGLPINSSGIISQIDRSADAIQKYCVRVPQQKEWFWLCEQDIEFASVINKKDADKMLRDHLIDLSLDKKDINLFEKAINKI